VDPVLPHDVLQGSTLYGNEYGWSISSFPTALRNAKAQGLACLGGQFQFRLDGGSTCEMYWLNADSRDRTAGESWEAYSQRSCSEVLEHFQHLASTADFRKEAASNWPSVHFDTAVNLVFVAYFVTEAELADLKHATK
jgi:hypothetical protein